MIHLKLNKGVQIGVDSCIEGLKGVQKGVDSCIEGLKGVQKRRALKNYFKSCT